MLGFVLAPLGQEVPGQFPNEIAFSYGGGGTFLCPPDPQWNQYGEQGLYYDTKLGGLGAIPTDAELATAYGWTPTVTGWVAAQEGYFPAPWRPPGGWDPSYPNGPSMSLSGLGDDASSPGNVTTTVTIPPGSSTSDAQAIVDALNAHNERIFKVTIISTVVVGIAAILNSYRVWKQLKRDEALLRRSLSTK